MDAAKLLDTLGYSVSPNFLPAARLGDSAEHAHIFRRAVQACRIHGGTLHGAYRLVDRTRASTPVVYVAEAATAAEADEIHRKLWNQNAAPFLLVRLPECLRLYSGFRFEHHEGEGDERSGLLEAAVAFDRVLEELAELHARAIDDGTLWRIRGHVVDPSGRVERRLLDNLKELGRWLRGEGLSPSVAHALIGKFVYLRYLRDREILSDRRLLDFEVQVDEVFGRRATMAGVRRLVERVDSWLNGTVFPFPFTGKDAPKAAQVRKVAQVFLGDDAETGQLHLDFRAYDFSYIPVETLSIIYEQFLAAEGKNGDKGAYYTPLPVVSFMLNELDELRPLERGMKILDPSCGSGAFLVQCYRRMIEQLLDDGVSLRPVDLRELLVRGIFGVDRDGDACRVAELSLILTMLDYVDPPDLLSTPSFKLPDLHNRNIFEADFFGDRVASEIGGRRFDWIVGNPPWLKLEGGTDGSGPVEPARSWMHANASKYPITGGQLAEAFAWKVQEYATEQAAIAMLVPSTTLLSENMSFRQAFFRSAGVTRVANFSNLREVLFAGRARLPAAALFYGGFGHVPDGDEVLVYSPLVANQEANRPTSKSKRSQTWTIALNRSEIRAISRTEAEQGSRRPWKMAMWGSARDQRLIELAERRYPSFQKFVSKWDLRVSEGLQLRGREPGREPVDQIDEVVGKMELDTELLRGKKRIYGFPADVLKTVSAERGFVRKGRAGAALDVCRPPHVIVSAARTFSVYSDLYIVVPPRQIGIGGSAARSNLLRALALYLSSDFVAYHQFFDATYAEARGTYTLAGLRRVPVPVGELDEKTLLEWTELHRDLAAILDPHERREEMLQLERELNRVVGDALGLSEEERWLIEDFVHVRKSLVDGRVDGPATDRPSTADISLYVCALKRELDAFLDVDLHVEHEIVAAPHETSGIVGVSLAELGKGEASVATTDLVLSSTLGSIQGHIDEIRGQWLYFDRNLVIHRPDRLFILKPMQRMWWTRSQALLDADQLIAESLAPESS